MLDLFLSYFVIVAPVVMAILFPFVPPKRERPRVFKAWIAILIAFAVAFSVLALWQQSRARIQGLQDKAEAVAAANVQSQKVIDQQTTLIDGLQIDVDQQGTNALLAAKRQFDATSVKVNKVLHETTNAAELSSRNLDALNGTDSFPCLNPGLVKNHRAPLDIGNFGPNPLTGVTYRMYAYKKDNLTPDDVFYGPEQQVGTIAGNGQRRIPGGLVLKPEDQDMDGSYNYRFEINTQNGMYREQMRFEASSNYPGYKLTQSLNSSKWGAPRQDGSRLHFYAYDRCHRPYDGKLIPDGVNEIVP